MAKRRFFSKILFLVNWFFTIGLLISYFAPFINPSKFYLIGLMGLSFPFWLLGNLIFVGYWLYRFKKEIFLSLIVIFMGITPISKLFQWSGEQMAFQEGHKLRLMSYNVRLFNLYRWIDKPNIAKKQIDLVLKEKVDILAFQEFLQTNTELARLQYPYQAIKLINPSKNYGLAIYSKYPIIQSELLFLTNETSNSAMYADIKYKNDTIRIFNVHLASLKLGASDYKFLDNITPQQSEDVLKRGTKKIITNMSKAYQQRAAQTIKLEQHLKNSPYPVILMGDFNDVPQSFTYRTLSNNLEDAFVESGYGFGKTYTKYLPTFRIDYILHDSQWKAFNYKVIKQHTLSDHYPIVCDLTQ